MNKTQTHTFKIPGFEKPVRQYGDPECPLFSAVEICQMLGIQNSKLAISKLDADSRLEITLPDTNGKPQPITLITLPATFDLAWDSNTPKTQKYKKWLFSEVLPSIRKTGRYKFPRALGE